jgi:hypothetical protein
MSNNDSDIVSQYGIGKRYVSITPFDGSDPSKLPAFKLDITVYLHEKGIKLPSSKGDLHWLEINQLAYAERTASKLLVDAAILADPVNQWMIDLGYVIGDCQLNAKERRLYLKDLETNNIKKQLAVQIFKQFIVAGSGSEAAISNGYNLMDFRIMWWDLLDFYEGLLLSNGTTRVYAIHNFYAGPSSNLTSMNLIDKMKQKNT